MCTSKKLYSTVIDSFVTGRRYKSKRKMSKQKKVRSDRECFSSGRGSLLMSSQRLSPLLTAADNNNSDSAFSLNLSKESTKWTCHVYVWLNPRKMKNFFGSKTTKPLAAILASRLVNNKRMSNSVVMLTTCHFFGEGKGNIWNNTISSYLEIIETPDRKM